MNRLVVALVALACACGGDALAGTCTVRTKGVSIGDSIPGSPTHQEGYPELWHASGTLSTLADYTTGGATSSEILSIQWTGYADNNGFTKVIINGGTNDCFASSSPANAATRAALVQSNNQTIATDAAAQGMEVVVVNIPPAKNFAAWHANMQTCIDTYNAAYTSMTSVDCFVDVYSALDVDNDDDMDAGFDSGDGLHPNATGAVAVKDAIVAACGAY